MKGDHWYNDSGQLNPASDRGIEASIDMLQEDYPLAGIMAEGLAPFATLSASQERALLRAVYRRIPVVKTARGDAHGLVRLNPANLFIEGNNLTATKARLLLTAAIMKTRQILSIQRVRSSMRLESGSTISPDCFKPTDPCDNHDREGSRGAGVVAGRPTSILVPSVSDPIRA